MKVRRKVLCTFPGKHGDCLWALPTMRAIAETIGSPVDLLLPMQYGSPGFLELLDLQPYIGRAMAMPEWEVRETAPMTPREPPLVEGAAVAYGEVVHLGYKGWPAKGLPFEIYSQTEQDYPDLGLLPVSVALNLSEPWIRLLAGSLLREWFHDEPRAFRRIAVGFTDEWFELKYGVTWLLGRHNEDWEVRPIGNSPRWTTEGEATALSWIEAADCLSQAEIFVGCCSALHVLSVAMGRPTIVVEPNEQRHNRVFWPLGTDGPAVRGVRGGDGKLTFDARAVCQVVEQELKRTEIHT